MPPTRADRAQRDQERARVQAAEAGDPRAVREILTALEAWLRGRDRIPRCYAAFCADGFNAFLEDSKAWGPIWNDHYHSRGADTEFATRDRSMDSPVESILGLGARLSEQRRLRIGTAACRAFRLMRRLASTEQARIAASEGASTLGYEVIRLTSHLDVPALERAWEAQCGDPKALRRLLHAVEDSLCEGTAIPGPIAFFCADSLGRWIEDDDAWERIERSAQGTGPSPPTSYGAVYKLARSFCRAFHLSRPGGRLKPGEVPHEPLFCHEPVYKLERLLRHGVSWSGALAIVSGAYPYVSTWALDEWARLMEFKPGAIREGALAKNRLRMAAQVLRETVRGRHPEEVYVETAHWLARRLLPSRQIKRQGWAGERSTLVPDALIPELIPAVRQAHAFSLQLTDQWPRWSRVWARLERRYSRQLLAS